jgi:hypothetical protein
MPKFIALPGVFMRDLLGRLIGNRPFERPWMIKYLDYKLSVDAAYTRKQLNWEPTPRYHILRRLLFLIEKMKSQPVEWHRKNTTALSRDSLRPNLLIYDIMVKLKPAILETVKAQISDPQNSEKYKNYQQMDEENLDWSVGIILQLLTSSVRNNDRMLLLDYARNLANIRFGDGFNCQEMCDALFEIAAVVTTKLQAEPELKEFHQIIHDYISMTIQLTADELEDAYEHFEKQAAISREKEIREIEERLNQMETFYRSPDER